MTHKQYEQMLENHVNTRTEVATELLRISKTNIPLELRVNLLLQVSKLMAVDPKMFSR